MSRGQALRVAVFCSQPVGRFGRREEMASLQRFAFVRRGRSWVPSPLAGEGQGGGKSSGNESTHPNEKCRSGVPLTEKPPKVAFDKGLRRRSVKEILPSVCSSFAGTGRWPVQGAV